jgi:hypothetical protein
MAKKKKEIFKTKEGKFKIVTTNGDKVKEKEVSREKIIKFAKKNNLELQHE